MQIKHLYWQRWFHGEKFYLSRAGIFRKVSIKHFLFNLLARWAASLWLNVGPSCKTLFDKQFVLVRNRKSLVDSELMSDLLRYFKKGIFCELGKTCEKYRRTESSFQRTLATWLNCKTKFTAMKRKHTNVQSLALLPPRPWTEGCKTRGHFEFRINLFRTESLFEFIFAHSNLFVLQ